MRAVVAPVTEESIALQSGAAGAVGAPSASRGELEQVDGGAQSGALTITMWVIDEY